MYRSGSYLGKRKKKSEILYAAFHSSQISLLFFFFLLCTVQNGQHVPQTDLVLSFTIHRLVQIGESVRNKVQSRLKYPQLSYLFPEDQQYKIFVGLSPVCKYTHITVQFAVTAYLPCLFPSLVVFEFIFFNFSIGY